MDENEVLGADAEAGTGTEVTEPEEESGVDGEESGEDAVEMEGEVLDTGTGEIVIDTSQFASEIAVLEEKLDVLTGQATVLTDKVTGCYCMLLILAVLGLRNVFRSIIRKVRGGMEDV